MSKFYIHCENHLKAKFPFLIENIITDGKYMGLISSQFQIFSSDKKIFSKNLHRCEIIHLNEHYLAHSQRDFFDGLWTIEIYRHGDYENILDSIILKTSIFPLQFQIYDHFLGCISYNSLYYINFSVFDLRLKKEIRAISLKKYDPDQNPTSWVFHYFTPFLEITKRFIIVTTGLGTCHLYSFIDEEPAKIINVSGKIMKIISNDDFLVLFSHTVTSEYTIVNLETFEKQVFSTDINLYDPKVDHLIDIGKILFAYYYDNVIEIFNFELNTTYQFPLPNNLDKITALSVNDNKILLVTYDNNSKFSSLIEFQFVTTPIYELQLVLHKTSLGPITSNFDVKNYIMEFFGKPLRKKEFHKI